MRKMYTHGDRLYYKCNDGYDMYYSGDRYSYSECKDNGQWNYMAPTCRRKNTGECPYKLYLVNQFNYIISFFNNTNPSITGYCVAPYVKYGISTTPTRVRYIPGEKISYRCMPGYQMMYHGERYQYSTCMSSGNWNYKAPMCMDMKKSKKFY